jgi:hypothetical protein
MDFCPVLKTAKSYYCFVMSVCPPLRLSVRFSVEQTVSHWADIHEICYLRNFPAPVNKIQVSLKSDNNNGTLHEDLCAFMIISR